MKLSSKGMVALAALLLVLASMAVIADDGGRGAGKGSAPGGAPVGVREYYATGNSSGAGEGGDNNSRGNPGRILRQDIKNLQDQRKDILKDVRKAMQDRFTVLKGDDAVKAKFLDRSTLTAFSNLSDDQIRAQLGNLTLKNIGAWQNSSQFQQAKAQFEDAKQRFDQAKLDFEHEKDAFQLAVKQGKQQAAIDAAKAYLVKIGDMAIASLQKIRSAALQSNSTDSVAVVADMDSRIAALQSAVADVQNATTKDQVKAAGNSIIQTWNRVRVSARVDGLWALREQVLALGYQAEAIERKMNRGVDALNASGIDSTNLSALVDEYSAKVQDAKDKGDQVLQLVAQARAAQLANLSIDGYVTQGRTLVQGAQDDLKAAQQIVKDFVKQYRDLGGKMNILEQDRAEDHIVVDDDRHVNMTASPYHWGRGGSDGGNRENQSEGTVPPATNNTTVGNTTIGGQNSTVANVSVGTNSTVGAGNVTLNTTVNDTTNTSGVSA